MPRMKRAMDRPSRTHLFLRRQRRLIGPALLGLMVLAGGAGALHVGLAMRSERSFAPIRAEIGRLAGLRVTDIVIQGRDMTSESQVLTALGVSRGDPLLGFSVAAARERLDQLPFVDHATVERRMPGTVLVSLVERRPYAVWQDHGRFVLIDRKGAIVESHGMTGKDADAFAELPLVVGPGAAEAAAALIDDLAAEPAIRHLVVASIRVGRRRWNLLLRGGTDVLLPEGAEPQALRRLAQYEGSMKLLERPLQTIDMRLPDRLVLRPRPATGPGTSSSSGGSLVTPQGASPGVSPGRSTGAARGAQPGESGAAQLPLSSHDETTRRPA